MNKKLLLTSFLLCFMLPFEALAQSPEAYETPWSLVVWQKDGAIVLFNLGEKPKITYYGDNVIIKSSSTVEYEFQSIKKMSYSTDDIDRINDLTVKQVKPFTSSDGTITFLPAEEELHVRIILMNGIVVKDFLVRKGESSTLPLPSSPEKIYMINVNGVTYKMKTR